MSGLETMSDEAFRRAELRENTERLDLDDYEASKQRLAEIKVEAAAIVARIQHEVEGYLSSNSDDNSPRARKHSKTGKAKGRPKKGASRKAVAEATGISPTEQIRIEEHVRLGIMPFT